MTSKDEYVNFEIRTCPAAVSLEKKIRDHLQSGKISKKAVKDFLKKYYEGDPDCAGCPTGCKDPEQCFIDTHLALIDDQGQLHDFGEDYNRDGQLYCCARPTASLENGKEYCSVCGTEHDER